MNINLNKLLEVFQEKYMELYDGLVDRTTYSRALDNGDRFISENIDFVREFNKLREDILSSDREVAAFAMALEELGIRTA